MSSRARFCVVIILASPFMLTWLVISENASEGRFWLGATLLTSLICWWGVPWIMAAEDEAEDGDDPRKI